MRRPHDLRLGPSTRLIVLIVFGVAFGFVEAAVVYDLRNLLGFHAHVPIPHYHSVLNLGFINFVTAKKSLLVTRELTRVETVREVCTIVMLGAVALLSTRTWLGRLGAFLVGFSCWDLAYYGFLRVIDHWPQSLMTRDVFFLIPVMWIGPVITPLVIFTLLLLLGAWLVLRLDEPWTLE